MGKAPLTKQTSMLIPLVSHPVPGPIPPLRAPAPRLQLHLSPRVNEKVAGVLLSALIAFVPLDSDARVGGRVGGRAPAAAPRSVAPRTPAVAPRQTTNIYVAPTPMYGYGYGYSPFGGGISTSAYLGLSLVETLIREQQRQAYLQQQLRTQQELGRDQAMIQQLQADIAAQNAKVDSLKAQQAAGGALTPSTESGSVQLLQQQLIEQQKQIEALKAAAK